MLQIEKLEWDSVFFGINVGKFEVKNGCLQDDFTEVTNFDLVYFFVDPDDHWSNQILIKKGALLVDEKVTYAKKVEITETGIENVISYQRRNNSLDNEVVRIGLQSSLYSRFCLDPSIKKEDSERLYKIWMERSIDREIAKEVFVYIDDEGKVQGVITVGERGERANIGILAVDKDVRGKHIGKKLIQKTEEYCLKESYNQFQVVTQRANAGACKFYEKCGFSIIESVNIYHYWPQK